MQMLKSCDLTLVYTLSLQCRYPLLFASVVDFESDELTG